MAIIIPAILEKTKQAFNEKAALVTKIPGVQRIQVDFANNTFVPNVLLAVDDIGTLNPIFEWEAHLMITEPKDFLDYQICGFKTIIIHFEAFNNLKDLIGACMEIKSLGLTPEICFNQETNIEEALKFKDLVNHFQLMGIVPGFQGTTFFPETINRIKHLRQILPRAIIEVDGGVDETNIKSIKDAGADLIIAGSAVVKNENPAAAFERLSALVR